ncbi:MAG: hypothetical protein PHI86_05300 [Candidatus Omnitrophica bacterium]|nr:hypothetical protein [Candidatus Omnitrophota bacterium]HOX54103.1 hypothetical protein [Candidatus Omnitrophota bacterium]
MKKKKKEIDNLDFEIEFYEKVLGQSPNFKQALIALGDAYTRKGHYHKGLKVDKKLIKLKPNDPIVFYNLSCSYSLLEMKDLAFGALFRAIDLGYDDFEHLKKDPDLTNLRQDSRYLELISKFQNSK